MYSLRSRAAFGLAALSALAAVVMLMPTLSREHWLIRLALRETSLVLTILGAGACLLARRERGRERLDRPAAVLGCGAALAGLAVFGAPLLWSPPPQGFSATEYALGGLLTPTVREDHDLVLEPSRPELVADVYHAPGAGPHPFVVEVHGGSWRGGDKGEFRHVARRLAAAGFTVLDVRYGLAPSHPFPSAIRDVKCLLGAARARAADLRLDPQRAALLGRSAGGQIALVAAYSAGDARLPPSCPVVDAPVRAVAAIYTPTDLVYGHAYPMRPDVVRGTESIEVYLGGRPETAPEAYRLGSPTSWVDRAVPPSLLIHGDGDSVVRLLHSWRLRDALSAQGHDARMVPVRFGEHGFDVRPGGVGEQIARGWLLDFFGRHLARS